ncbi:MAG: hypothetical protein ACXWW9_05420 [Actinomycetota bacterium]|jgi:hypothetical protein
MRKKALFGLLAVPLAFLLSSCFVLQGFWVVANSIPAGGKGTKAVFQLHPSKYATGDNGYQFFLVGVSNSNDLTVGKATWGANGTFGGPYKLPVSAPLAGAVATSGDCVSNGFNFGDATGVTWKGFITPGTVNDRNKINKDLIVEAGLKAAADAEVNLDNFVIGVTGVWIDDDDSGTPSGGDIFYCSGVSQVNVTVT